MSDWVSVGDVLWRLRQVLVGQQPDRVQIECRQCGTNIHEPRQHCPECGSADLVRHEL